MVRLYKVPPPPNTSPALSACHSVKSVGWKSERTWDLKEGQDVARQRGKENETKKASHLGEATQWLSGLSDASPLHQWIIKLFQVGHHHPCSFLKMK